ncbi:MAG TPA: HAMP domain-containing sensor histidine kinase [Holophagaceae bacterium]
MYRHRATRFRRLHPSLKGPTRWQRLQQRSGLVLLTLAGIVTAALLVIAPFMFLQDQLSDAMATFSDAHWNDFEAVERHWKSLPILGSLQTGNEPEIRNFLADQPLVVALLDRFDRRTLWVRAGDRLVKAPDSSLAQLYLDWTSHAEAAQRFEWNPPKNQDPDFGKVASIVLLSDRWLVIKRWTPGTPEVDQELARALGPNPTLRMGLIREVDEDAKHLKSHDWNKSPHLQIDAYRYADYFDKSAVKTNAFGEGWELAGIALVDQENAYRKSFRKQALAAFSISISVGLAIVLGLWLRARARKRAVLDADRMASLTHSLKTPLALLKFRCDSLRLGRLSPERADEELLRIGEEVDHLALIIENGLRVIRGGGATGPRAKATPEWITTVAEDLRPGFELENRRLVLDLCPDSGQAPLSSLRAALFTLLENALGHGRGTVTLETRRLRRRLSFQIRDEGEGLAPHQVKALGRPFQRLREMGKEGFLREGQGLGLSLLVQVAEQEGWGLSFASAPGEGLVASLEIPLA